ncbi:MAG TPA: carbohydrate-binding domain-containing protein [Polyangiaceae bacterium]|nr:carbohydrate-binding domain-containing protein [Polyangiaceae bacterium]
MLSVNLTPRRLLASSCSLLALTLPGWAVAQVPAGYTGTPFGGTPRAIPGRIDFEDFDVGAEEVSWRQDDDTGTQFGDGCAGNGYRPDDPHPQLCMTNPTEGDAYSEGPLMGMPYPLDESGSIYIGYTHVGEWVKITVDVAQAGTYLLSSTWASEGGGDGGVAFQLLFNDVEKADVSLPGTGGYHNWVAHDDFAMVELDAGVQVMQFIAGSQHLNYDYIQLSLVLPGGGVDDGSGGPAGGAGGAAGVGGADGAGGAAAGAGGVGGTAGSAGAGGAAAGAGGVGGSPSGVAGSPATAGGGSGGQVAAAGSPAGVAGTTGVPTTPNTTASSTSSEGSGCSTSVAQSPRGVSLAFGLVLAGVSLMRRRRGSSLAQ